MEKHNTLLYGHSITLRYRIISPSILIEKGNLLILSIYRSLFFYVSIDFHTYLAYSSEINRRFFLKVKTRKPHLKELRIS